MKKLLLNLTILTILFGQQAFALDSVFGMPKVPSLTGDYCKDQVLEALHASHGENVQIQIVFVDGSGDTLNYWMKTNIQDGYLIASFVKNASCTTTHYGFVPQYLKSIWAF